MMMRRSIVLVTGLLLAAVVARAGESEASPAKPPVAPPANAGEAGEFVVGLYKALESQTPDLSRLAAAIDPDLLLEQATAGLSSRPPEAWNSAARLRLARDVPNMVRTVFPEGVIAVGPRAVGSATSPDGSTTITVRFYRIDLRGGAPHPAWHLVRVVRKTAGWRLADIDQLDNGDRLSYAAIERLTDPREEKLPRQGGGPVGVLLLKTLLAGALIALVLGLVFYFALVRPVGDGPGRRPRVLVMWVAILGPVLVGGVLFLSGLMEHMDRDAAVDEFHNRSLSLRVTAEAEAEVSEAMRQNNAKFARQLYAQALRKLEMALTSQQWANRRAQLIKIKVLALAGDRAGAEADLKVLASEAMQPPMPAANLELSQLYQRAKKWRAAGEALMGFSKAVGNDALIFCNAAQCFAMAGSHKRAAEMIALAEKAQRFDNTEDLEDLSEYDGTLILSRAAVRAAARKVDAAIEDFRLFLKPVEGNPQMWLRKVQDLDQKLRTGQFNNIVKDPKFRAYMSEIQKKINAIIKKRPARPAPPGGPR